jgi:hypothetical protein
MLWARVLAYVTCAPQIFDKLTSRSSTVVRWHLKRLLSEYVRYYQEDRTHLGLGKGRLTAGFVRRLWVASFLTNGLADYTIVTIGLPDSQHAVLKPKPETPSLCMRSTVTAVAVANPGIGRSLVVQFSFLIQTLAMGNCAVFGG